MSLFIIVMEHTVFTKYSYYSLQFQYPKSQKDLVVLSHDIAVSSVKTIQEEGEGSLTSLIIFQTVIKYFLDWLETKRPTQKGELLNLFNTMKKCLETIIQV